MSSLIWLVTLSLFTKATETSSTYTLNAQLKLGASRNILREPLGYARTRVALASSQVSADDLAAFILIKESAPLENKPEAQKISIKGMQFEPNIASCAVDGKVEIENLDETTYTVRYGTNVVAKLDPNQKGEFLCTAENDPFRRLRIDEWPYIRASIYVGDIGVPLRVAPSGELSVKLLSGKYELIVVSSREEMLRRPIEINAQDISLGTIFLNAKPSGSSVIENVEKTVTPDKNTVQEKSKQKD